MEFTDLSFLYMNDEFDLLSLSPKCIMRAMEV